jgi:nicotinate-nucleotide pyrophosphorylase (carboxylating)
MVSETSDPSADFRLSARTRSVIKLALEEDVGDRDLTSDVLIPRDEIGAAVVIAKESGIFCGAPVMRELFAVADPAVRLDFKVAEGGRFKKNQVVVGLRGRIRSILKVERTAINFLGHLSGIAGKARLFVKAVKRYPVIILDTRKTTPLLRELEKYAVRTGGARNHRMGLYDAILIKENHRPHADFSRLEPYKGNFEIEVRDLNELRDALKHSPRVILFDNFTPARLRGAIQLVRRKNASVIIEVSGGITLENVEHYAAMGVDWISIGSLTHSIRSVDFSLLVK